MVTNRWQKRHPLFQHASLAICWGAPLFILEISLDPLSKVFLIMLVSGLTWIAGVGLTRAYPKSMVRVFRFEEDVAIGIVQRALTSSYIPYNRQNGTDEIRYHIRGTHLVLTIQDYPLNLPVDSHIQTTTASKIEIFGIRQDNQTDVDRLCNVINQTVAARVKA